ncbi:MAG: YceI family protein [Oligoflexia bacterium]|nr:YceI family protein [Oligoflexia bacterium]
MSKSLTTWQLDPAHSSANFSVKHMMIAKVHGGFHKLSGELRLDPSDPASSSVVATIEAASIDTRESQRDAHLRSADFFDVEKFPTITFRSRSMSRTPDSGLRVVGDLTLHGITREVTLEVEPLAPEAKDPWGNLKLGVSAMTKIKRKDFGLTWNAALEAGGVLVGDDIAISLDIQFVKKP